MGMSEEQQAQVIAHLDVADIAAKIFMRGCLDRNGMVLAEALSAAQFGLCKASLKFDALKHKCFRAYARKACDNQIRNDDIGRGPMRIPQYKPNRHGPESNARGRAIYLAAAQRARNVQPVGDFDRLVWER